MANSTIILVTGANTGLGLETVKSLLRSSTAYTVILGGRSLDKAKAAAKEAETEYPDSKSKIDTTQIDIEDDESIKRACEAIEKKYGKLDVLLNNAGQS
jgi:NADP-dependent 3-hydroxy acid dehydrogenase YdfG